MRNAVLHAYKTFILPNNNAILTILGQRLHDWKPFFYEFT